MKCLRKMLDVICLDMCRRVWIGAHHLWMKIHQRRRPVRRVQQRLLLHQILITHRWRKAILLSLRGKLHRLKQGGALPRAVERISIAA